MDEQGKEWFATLHRDGMGDVRENGTHTHIVSGIGAACQLIAAEHNELLAFRRGEPGYKRLEVLMKEREFIASSIGSLHQSMKGHTLRLEQLDEALRKPIY